MCLWGKDNRDSYVSATAVAAGGRASRVIFCHFTAVRFLARFYFGHFCVGDVDWESSRDRSAGTIKMWNSVFWVRKSFCISRVGLRSLVRTFVVDFAVVFWGVKVGNLYILGTALHHELELRIMGDGRWFFFGIYFRWSRSVLLC